MAILSAETKKILRALAEIVMKETENDGEVPLPGGKFKVCRTSARVARNPKSGESPQIPASRKVCFSFAAKT